MPQGQRLVHTDKLKLTVLVLDKCPLASETLAVISLTHGI